MWSESASPIPPATWARAGARFGKMEAKKSESRVYSRPLGPLAVNNSIKKKEQRERFSQSATVATFRVVFIWSHTRDSGEAGKAGPGGNLGQATTQRAPRPWIARAPQPTDRLIRRAPRPGFFSERRGKMTQNAAPLEDHPPPFIFRFRFDIYTCIIYICPSKFQTGTIVYTAVDSSSGQACLK